VYSFFDENKTLPQHLLSGNLSTVRTHSVHNKDIFDGRQYTHLLLTRRPIIEGLATISSTTTVGNFRVTRSEPLVAPILLRVLIAASLLVLPILPALPKSLLRLLIQLILILGHILLLVLLLLQEVQQRLNRILLTVAVVVIVVVVGVVIRSSSAVAAVVVGVVVVVVVPDRRLLDVPDRVAIAPEPPRAAIRAADRRGLVLLFVSNTADRHLTMLAFVAVQDGFGKADVLVPLVPRSATVISHRLAASAVARAASAVARALRG